MAIQRIGDRDVILTDRLTSVSQEDVQLLVRRFHAAILSYGLYPAGHTLIVKRTQDLQTHLVKMFKQAQLLVIKCEQSLSVNNTRLLRDVPEKEQSMKVASYLGLRGVKNVVLWPQVEQGELGELIQALHSINEEEEEESSDWVQQYRSYHVRLNMDLVDSVELEAAAHGGHTAPIAISKQELADIISQIGPDGQSQPQQHRGGSSQIQLVDSPGGGGQSGAYGGPSQSTMSGVTQSGGIVQAQQVLQQVGGQVVQAQQVIQQHIQTVAPPEYAGMTYPPQQGQQGHPHSPSMQHTPHGGNPYPQGTPHGGNPYSQGTPPRGNTNPYGARGGHPHSGDLSDPYNPSMSGHSHPNAQGASHHPHMPGTAPAGYSVHNLQQGHSQQHDTRLPPGLRQPAAYHPAHHNEQIDIDDLPTAPGAFEINPMGPVDDPYGGSNHEDKTVIQRMPGSASVADLLPGRSPEMHPHGHPYNVGQSTPSVDDLPSVQGYMLDDAYANPVHAGSGASNTHLPPGIVPSRESGFSVVPNPMMGQLPNPLSQSGLSDVYAGMDIRPPTTSGMREVISGGQWSSAAQSLPPDWVTVDPLSLDQSELDLSQLDFGKIEPNSLFQSQRFREYLEENGTGLFLSRFLATIMSGVDATKSGHVSVVQSEGGWLGTGAGRALLSAVEQLEGLPIQQQVVHSLAETISSTIPELVDEQLAHLGITESEQKLREEVIQQIPQEKRLQLGEMLGKRLHGEDNPDKIDNCMASFSLLAEDNLDNGVWRMLIPTLEALVERQTELDESNPLHQKLSGWQSKLATPSVGRILFQQLLRSKEKDIRAEARRGILAMGAASAYNLTLFLELANDSRSEKILCSLVRDIGRTLDDVEQTLFFDQIWATGEGLPPARHAGLCLAMYEIQPGFIEKHIVEKIDALENSEEPIVTESDWVRWIDLALHCHTPRLRQYLGRYMQQRKFMDHPNIEERMLKLLDGHGTLEGFQFLEHIIHNERLDIKEKTSALWLVGCLRSEEALLLLRSILLERRRFLRQPVYHKDMRYQALDALRHFPHNQVSELIKKVLQDPEDSIKTYAQQMLEHPANP